jgi:hypothetical protein
MVRAFKPVLPAFLVRRLIDLRVSVLSYSERSYSQEGEDMIWHLFRPEYVVVECWELRLNDIQADPVVKFLDQMGYDLFAKGFSTAFFKDRACHGPG